MTGTEILPALDPPPPNIDQAESTRRWRGHGPWSVRKVGLVIGIVLAGLTAAYVIALLMVGGNIPRGTTVAGVDIGGLTPTAAEERLNAELAPATADVVVELAGRSRTIPATKLGVSFDAAATVQGIEGRSYLPWELARQLTGTTVPPVVTSGRQLDRLVASLAKRVDEEPRQGRVRYHDMEIVTVPPKPGQALDEETAREAIIDGYLAADDPIELAVVAVQPDVTSQQIQQVAEGAAVDAISAAVTLTVADRTIEISPEQIAEVLTFRPVDGAMSAVVDTAELRSGLDTELASIGTPARDASFDVSSGKPVVIPAERGRGVSDDTLGDGLVDALSDSSRSADLPIGPIPADLTTAEAKHLGVHRVISTFTQVFPYAAYRVTNIGLASEKINGTVLEPGETFSLNGVVGERTPENGFVKGYVIVGNRLVEDYGGAVSTMTTAVWHTAFYAGMTRIEQRAHGYWISRYLPGLEATVSWGNLDLKFRNDTPYGVLITTSVSDTSVTVTMWSTKYWDIKAEFGPRTNPRPAGTVYDPGEGCVAQYGVDGFDITVTRVWSRDGEVKRREPLDTSYTSAPTVICAPKPTPEPKPDNSDKPKPDNSDKPKPSPSDSPSPDNTGGGGGGDNSG